MSDMLKPCPFCNDPMRMDGGVFNHVHQTAGCPIRQNAWQDSHLKAWNARTNAYEPMLAALEALHKMADGDEPDYDEDGEEIEPFALMRAAIALAKGETS